MGIVVINAFFLGSDFWHKVMFFYISFCPFEDYKFWVFSYVLFICRVRWGFVFQFDNQHIIWRNSCNIKHQGTLHLLPLISETKLILFPTISLVSLNCISSVSNQMLQHIANSFFVKYLYHYYIINMVCGFSHA